MTPAHLRDTERNGRYPGRYFGVFLREYARALQFTTGLTANGDGAEERLAQQATSYARRELSFETFAERVAAITASLVQGTVPGAATL